MRTMGVYRGNPTLRVAIGQALRRRLYAELVPHDASRGAVPGAGEADALDRRWSREFHDALRVHALPLIAPIERPAEGVLRYFGRPGFSLWALHSDHTLVLAYDYHDTPEELRAALPESDPLAPLVRALESGDVHRDLSRRYARPWRRAAAVQVGMDLASAPSDRPLPVRPSKHRSQTNSSR